MTGIPIVGVIGASGAVGRTVVALLRGWNVCRLRLGARRADRTEALARGERGSEAYAVDVYDDERLAAFCDGCSLVLNCAGPSFQILDRVAVAAIAAGADYVDPGGDAPLYRRLERFDIAGSGRVALVTAGMMPGLSGLLPRWLARDGSQRFDRMTAYVGGIGRMTPAGARDYLLSLGAGIGEPLAAWRNGQRVSRELAPVSGMGLSCFPVDATAHPFLSPETERVARRLGLADVEWYSVFDGSHLRSTLGRLQAAIAGHGDLEKAADELSRAADLDLFGREPYQAMFVELSGGPKGGVRRRAVLRAADPCELTGAVAALAACAVLRGEVERGVHYAADALDPTLVDRLRDIPAVRSLDAADVAEPRAAAEEGVV